MKKSLLVPLAVLAAFLVMAGSAFTQVQTKPGIVGTWLGTAVVGDESNPIDLVVVIERTDLGYSGKLSDTAGMVPESPLREIVFKDNKLACLFDLDQGSGTVAIKIELTLEAETLKGLWSDPDGNSGAIALALKK